MGLLTGPVTGFLGAGGGFLIIPALVYFARLPMKSAITTSLLIISLNSLAGFAGDVVSGIAIDYKLVLVVSAMAIAGMFIGAAISMKIDGSKLKPLFGWFILIIGVFIVIKEISAV